MWPLDTASLSVRPEVFGGFFSASKGRVLMGKLFKSLQTSCKPN